MRLRAGLLALLILISAPALALDPRKAITQYGQDSWTTRNGLPQDSVRAIAQTADGDLWLGTQAGLARFDGVRFTTYDSRNTPALSADDHILTLLASR
jgi:ligand-binding sensor domain-containing protein